jgi:hypothetical protein
MNKPWYNEARYNEGIFYNNKRIILEEIIVK